MKKSQTPLFFVVVMVLALGASPLVAEQRKADTSSGALVGAAVTTSQTAVFAAFLSNSGPSVSLPAGINTAISISNILATPSFESDFINIGGADDTGAVSVYLWDRDSTFYSYRSDDDCTAGVGLNSDGTIGPGQTWTVLLADILECAAGDRATSFNGYGWVVGDFDAIAGTYNVVIFDVGFTQSFVLTPAVGTGQTFTGGLPVSVVP